MYILVTYAAESYRKNIKSNDKNLNHNMKGFIIYYLIILTFYYKQNMKYIIPLT